MLNSEQFIYRMKPQHSGSEIEIKEQRMPRAKQHEYIKRNGSGVDNFLLMQEEFGPFPCATRINVEQRGLTSARRSGMFLSRGSI